MIDFVKRILEVKKTKVLIDPFVLDVGVVLIPINWRIGKRYSRNQPNPFQCKLHSPLNNQRPGYASIAIGSQSLPLYNSVLFGRPMFLTKHICCLYFYGMYTLLQPVIDSPQPDMGGF